MNKSVKAIVSIIALAAFTAPAAAQYEQVMENVLRNTDPAISGPVIVVGNGDAFSIPEPLIIKPETKDTATEFFPMRKSRIYEYEYTSSEFLGSRKLTIEYLDYSEKEGFLTARLTAYNRNTPWVEDYSVRFKADGLHATSSPLGGPRVEIPLPLYQNRSWTEGAYYNRVTSLKHKVTVPAGTFENCLRILTKIGGGDAGSAYRVYAPGVGLVEEALSAEDRQDHIRLVAIKQVVNL
ncbi:MAG: hypothetical protein RDU13_10055 [Elusimicrobiales bacterium]|jgi:hypothetical protein|nr:hypothetical protein [Elusimicrobiales bacterium]